MLNFQAGSVRPGVAPAMGGLPATMGGIPPAVPMQQPAYPGGFVPQVPLMSSATSGLPQQAASVNDPFGAL